MGKIVIDKEKCKGCYICIQHCPVGTISISKTTNTKGYQVIEVDEEECIFCGNCYRVCPDYVFFVETGQD